MKAGGQGGYGEGNGFAGEPEIAFGLLRALRNTAVSVFYQNPDMRVLWAQNIPPSWSSGNIVGLRDENFLPSTVAAPVTAMKSAVLIGAIADRMEICLPGSDAGSSDQWFDIWIDADTTPAGSVRGIVTTVVETTEQKRREQTLRVLLREVSHRSRNLLAIIQSIATQTGRYSSTIESFLDRFRGRLQSLASSQDLVTSSNWRGADLRELALGQASRYSDTPVDAILLEGEKPWLNPNAALHVGLALHELIANSMSYGALSQPQGKATLCASLKTNGSNSIDLTLTWTEVIASNGRPFEADMREKRFGSVALERVVPASLNGSAQLSLEAGVLVYELLIPAGQFEMA